MAKDLQTSVILETKTAEDKLDKLIKAINRVDDAINKAGSSTNELEKGFQDSIKKANKIEDEVKQVESAQKRVTNQVKKTNSEHKRTKSLLDGISSKVKQLAATYLGVMGMSAIIGASDTITKSENKLNQINGGNKAATQTQMDAMYAAAQRSRMGYGDMMSNVSKSMTLAPDAFGGDMKAAIAFQEVMAKSYALGGASQAEQSSSMYQLIQALGSGKLAGDELRSVTEGAPMAAKEIEKFAQEIYKTDAALKDMGADGMITSDIVVAAMLKAAEGADGINEKFKNTAMTFEQAWQKIKNTTMKAFEPVLQKMNKALNSEAGQAILNGIGRAIEIVANIIGYLFTKLEDVYNYIVDHWGTIKFIFLALASILGTQLLLTTSNLIAKLWQLGITAMTAGWKWFISFLPLIALVGILIVLLFKWAKTTQTITDFIYNLLYSFAIAIIGVLAMVLVAYLATGTLMLSVPVLIGLLIVGIIAVILAAFFKSTAEFVGGLYYIFAVSKAIFQNIGIWFSNMLNNTRAAFWDWVADLCEGLDWLLAAINAVAGFFGKGTITIGDMRAKADASEAKIKEYVNVGAAGRNAYAEGYAKGESIQNKINESGEKLKGLLNGNGLPSGLPGEGSGYSYNPADLLNNIADADGKTAKNTGKMADSMELAEEDLKLLYDLAEMEWKKEFTTANITVDMSNYNTVNGLSDLDGIATYLRDGLIEEMSAVANGAYSFG